MTSARARHYSPSCLEPFGPLEFHEAVQQLARYFDIPPEDADTTLFLPSSIRASDRSLPSPSWPDFR